MHSIGAFFVSVQSYFAKQDKTKQGEDSLLFEPPTAVHFDITLPLRL